MRLNSNPSRSAGCGETSQQVSLHPAPVEHGGFFKSKKHKKLYKAYQEHYNIKRKERGIAISKFMAGECTLKIKYPETSEREIQATLWKKIIDNGIDAKLEVTDRVKFDGTRSMVQNRFDIVVFLEKEAKIIIEVKKNGKADTLGRQMKKYHMYGIPVLTCLNEKEIDSCFSKVLEIMSCCKVQQ